MAVAVTTAPTPLIVARRCHPGSLVRRQWTTRPAWASVKPMNTPMANSGISVLVLPPTATSSSRREHGQGPDAVAEDQPAVSHPEEVRKVVVPRQQAGEHGQPAEGGVGGERQHQGDRERDDVVGPVTPDGVGHDLAQHGLVRPRLDVELVGEHGQPEQHHAPGSRPSRSSVRLARATRGSLKSGTPLAMASTPVRALQPAEKAFSTRSTRHRLHGVRRHERLPGLGGLQAERVDQTDGDDGQQPDDEHEGGDEEGAGALRPGRGG